jgi:arylsulfatase A-like enzyme
MEIRDLTPTILTLFGIDTPADLQGNVIAPVIAREPALL